MAQAARAGGLLPPLDPAPPLRVPAGVSREEPGESALPGELRGRRALPLVGGYPCPAPQPGGAPAGQRRWAEQVLRDAGEGRGVGAEQWQREPAGAPVPPALRRLRAELLRLHRERELLLGARDCARQLQAAVRLLGTPSAGAPEPLLRLCRDLLPRVPGLVDTVEPLLPRRLLGLATQRLDAAIEMQFRTLGQGTPSPSLASQLSELLLVLPAYHQLQGKALSHVPGAARPFPPARVLRLLAGERASQVASALNLGASDLRDRLRRRCQEERELLPGLLGLLGREAGPSSGGLGLGGAAALWSQYWTLLWAACAQSLDLRLGPWRDRRAAAQQLSRALGRASIPQECEKELASWCCSLAHQSLIWSWDQGFCQALGSAHRDQNNLPSSSDWGTRSSTSMLLQRLFSPLSEALQQPRAGPPGPAPLALGLCTLQVTLLWFWGRAHQSLAAWAPGMFLLLIQRDLPVSEQEVGAGVAWAGRTQALPEFLSKPVLQEVQALSDLATGESLALEGEQQLGLEIRKLAALIQLLPEESLGCFSRECHKQATQGFELYMPRGRYWRPPLCSELPLVPSEYAGLVLRAVLEPVLRGLRDLPPKAQVPALGPALTAVLSAWLDYILSQRIRFSLQGALQLRQDFAVVRELLEEEQWGLSPEDRQALLMLGVFQQLDGALLCLLQQPLPQMPARRGPPCCCACRELQPPELPSSSLNSLESLEPPPRLGAGWGGAPSPEAYLVGSQQAWLALRQHRRRPRWHRPFLFCLGTSPEQ
ncbi:coiled-coil domain-containing protein 142 [Rhynchocyon petersi]